jgi:general secretion pathway protein D
MLLVSGVGMSKRWCWMIALVAVVPRLATAQSHAELAAPAVGGGLLDETLYNCGTHKGPVTVTLKPDTEVKDLVTWVMSFTCKNFVLDPRIVATGKKVTVIAPNKMGPAEAYQTFLIALSTIGLTVVAKGSVMRIVEAAAAKKEALPIMRQLSGDGDQLVRLVVRPSYAQPEALRQAFTQLKSDAGDILVIGSTLVITDYASTLTGMLGLKKLIDVPAGTDGIYTVPVHHADAAKLAQMLTQMFSATPGPAKPGAPGGDPISAGEPVPSKILVDDRTNTLVISASEPAYQRVRALVERVDVAVDLEGTGSIHTYQLSSAIAEELAATLTKAISGDTGAPRTQRPAVTPAPGQPQPPAAAPGAALDGLGATLSGTVKVIADKSTNKLLITASARDFMALRDVIRELDLPRRQVYIEAMILEVDVSRGLDFGASAHAGTAVGDSGVGFGGVQLPQLSSTNPASALAAGGLISGLFGSSLPALTSLFGSAVPSGTTVPSYGVLIQALATRSTTNILSTPSIIAVDNEEAKSKIGENVPYIKGVIPTIPGSTATSFASNVERQPLELELSIKPHISSNDTILLEIKHNNGGIKDSANPLGPTWTTRNVETRVVVRDQETVLIGGLMQDSEIDGESKVPVLGDIPLLGYLFKYTKRSKHKTNLLIMLTPYIIKDQTDLQQIQRRKLRQSDEFFRSMASLSAMKFEAAVDYHRKRGLIEEINRAVADVEAEVATRGAITTPAAMPSGRVEVPAEPPAAAPGP